MVKNVLCIRLTIRESQNHCHYFFSSFLPEFFLNLFKFNRKHLSRIVLGFPHDIIINPCELRL